MPGKIRGARSGGPRTATTAKPVCETRAAGAGARIWEPVKEPIRESPAMLRRPAIFVWYYASAWVAVDGVRDVTGFRLRIKERGKALVGFRPPRMKRTGEGKEKKVFPSVNAVDRGLRSSTNVSPVSSMRVDRRRGFGQHGSAARSQRAGLASQNRAVGRGGAHRLHRPRRRGVVGNARARCVTGGASSRERARTSRRGRGAAKVARAVRFPAGAGRARAPHSGERALVTTERGRHGGRERVRDGRGDGGAARDVQGQPRAHQVPSVHGG